jgi:hypothetical protein
VKAQGKLLQFREEIGCEIVSHALAQTDIGVSGGHVHGPAEEKQNHGGEHGPADKLWRRVIAGQRLHNASDPFGHRLLPQDVVDEEHHGPGLQHIEARLHEHGGERDGEWARAPHGITQCPEAQCRHGYVRGGFHADAASAG